MAEELAFQKLLGDRRRVDRDKGFRPARPVEMDGACHDLLARAAFARHENGGARGRDLGDLLHHLLHPGRGADEPFDPVAPFQLLAQPVIVAQRVVEAQGVGDGGLQFLELDRLADIVEGPVLDELHGVAQRREGGHHDDRQDRMGAPDFGQKLAARQAGHPEIGEHEIDAFARQLRQCVHRAARLKHGIAEPFQHPAQHIQEALLVIDDQDRVRHGAGSWLAGVATGSVSSNKAPPPSRFRASIQPP